MILNRLETNRKAYQEFHVDVGRAKESNWESAMKISNSVASFYTSTLALEKEGENHVSGQ